MKFLISAFLLLTDTFVRPADSDHFVRCYKFNIISLPFHQAKQICADFGGHLVSLRGELEEAMFDEMAHQHRICPSYFLGDEVHGRAWINTRSKARGQLKRNETCATASSVDGVWNSVACSDPFSYVCATATSPSNDHRPCPRCPPIKACSGHCENGWTYFNKTDACYKTYFWQTFKDAENFCKMNGGHLTSIHSFEENAFVAALAETGIRWEQFTHPTWIGLKQENGSNRKFWTWTDGTKVDYLAWAPNQPDNFGTGESCTQIFADRCVNENTYPYQKWNDVSCTTMMRSFVCKKAALH